MKTTQITLNQLIEHNVQTHPHVDAANPAIVLDRPEQIAALRLLTLRQALGLEIAGLKMSRGASAYAIIKQEMGLKGSKLKVFDQFSALLDRDDYATMQAKRAAKRAAK